MYFKEIQLPIGGKGIDLTIGLRVSDKEEAIGLDQALHEESAYHI